MDKYGLRVERLPHVRREHAGGSISELFTSQGSFGVLRVRAKSVCVSGEIDHGFA
jgi:hypothetical protein